MPSDKALQLKEKVINRAKHDRKYLQELISNPDTALTAEAAGPIPSDFTLTTSDLTSAGVSLDGMMGTDSLIGGCIKC